jgi:hypothetical protein
MEVEDKENRKKICIEKSKEKVKKEENNGKKREKKGT